jgi:hypothetical protein
MSMSFPTDGIYKDPDTGLRFRFVNGVPIECIDLMTQALPGNTCGRLTSDDDAVLPNLVDRIARQAAQK